MTSFTQRAKVSLDIGWCGLPCVMKKWVHFSSTSSVLKCKYSLMQATRSRSLFSVYARKTIGLLGVQGFEHFVRPVMWHITFPPTSEMSIFAVSNLCKVYSRLPASIDNSIAVFKVNCRRVRSSFLPSPFKYSSTLLISHIFEYSGCGGSKLKTPFINRETKLCSPIHSTHGTCSIELKTKSKLETHSRKHIHAHSRKHIHGNTFGNTFVETHSNF